VYRYPRSAAARSTATGGVASNSHLVMSWEYDRLRMSARARRRTIPLVMNETFGNCSWETDRTRR
jgi:hypothetical protein